jgi:uncharacterized protein involved in type VI secretion and phage assembly
MADNDNNKKPESTNSIAPDKYTWTETPQNQSPENNDLEEDLELEKQPPQETSVTSISGEGVNLTELSPAEENPIEIEEETYSTEKEAYPPEKPYPEQPPKEPRINLEPEQTTTLIPIPPTLTELQTDTVTTIANKEEEGFIEENLAQHEQ